MFATLVFVTLLSCIVLRYMNNLVDSTFIKHGDVFYWGSVDLSVIGNYDFKLQNSLSTWIYSMSATLYASVPSAILYEQLKEWYATQKDDAKYIQRGVEDGWTRFLTTADSARELGKPVNFKVSEEFDYHVLPLSLKYNDHVDCQQLIDRVDSMIGGLN